MPQYIALLRGINVGGHRVKMDRLRTLFEELHLTDVSTFIASGNVIFSTDSGDVVGLRTTIERHLESELGYEVATFLRSASDLAKIAAYEPAGAAGQRESDSSHYVIFLDDPASATLQSALSRLNSETDAFHVVGTEVHWFVQGKLSDSPLFSGPGLDRATKGVRTTMRNMNTLRRIAAKTRAEEAT